MSETDRKAIQIAPIIGTDKIYVLYDDGSLWELIRGEYVDVWTEIPQKARGERYEHS